MHGGRHPGSAEGRVPLEHADRPNRPAHDDGGRNCFDDHHPYHRCSNRIGAWSAGPPPWRTAATPAQATPVHDPSGGGPHPPAGPGGGFRGLGWGAWSDRLAAGAAPCMADPLPGEHDDGPPAATLNLPAGCRVKPAVARRACPGADRGPGRARPVRAPHPRHTGRGPIASGAGRHIDGTSLSAAMWSRPPTPNACHVPRHGPTVGRAERGHRADATALAVRVKQVGTNAPRSAARPARRRAAV